MLLNLWYWFELSMLSPTCPASTCICFLLNILNWDGNNIICSKRNRLIFLSSVTYWDQLCCLCLVCLVFLQLICWSFIISTGYGECLLDEPVSGPYSLSQQLPGQIYSVNKQCELIFGPGTQVCPYMVRRSLRELHNILTWMFSTVYYLLSNIIYGDVFNKKP